MAFLPGGTPPVSTGTIYNGLDAGVFKLDASLLVNGVETDFRTASVSLNVYSLASTITADTLADPQKPKSAKATAGTAFDVGNVIDYGAMGQNAPNNLVPIQVNVALDPIPGSYDVSKPGTSIGLVEIERGYIDECSLDYDLNLWQLSGRSTASIFEEAPTAAALPKNATGIDLVQKFFALKGIQLTTHPNAPTGLVALGKSYKDEQYQKTLRNNSMWEYMQDAAAQDGFVLQMHGGIGYYGPAGGLNPPTFILQRGRDFEKQPRFDHAFRRSHNIVVRVDSVNPQNGQRVTAKYASSGGSGSQEYRFFVSGLTQHKARAMAYTIWKDIVTKEVIGHLDLVPDANMLRALNRYGCNFLIQMSGVVPSHALTYHVKQAELSIYKTSEQSDLALRLLIENHVPISGAGGYV